jgi:hypothetical protein
MSWIKKLIPKPPPPPAWETAPNDPDSYPEHCDQTIEKVLIYWKAEEVQLSLLKLPLPRKVSEYFTTFKENYYPRCSDKSCTKHPARYIQTLTINHPRYELPPHVCFYIPIKKMHAFITGPPALLDKAQQLYSNNDFEQLFKEVPIRWFNRHPYEFYIKAEEYHTSTHGEEYFTKGECNDILIPKYLNPLTELKPDLTDQTCVEMTERIALYSRYFGGVLGVPSIADVLQRNDKKSISDSLLFDVPLPQKAFNEELVTVKILPSPDSKVDVLEQFYSSLHHSISQWFTFEVVAESGTIYYQFTWAKVDHQHIQQQLQLHFPDCGIINHQDGAKSSTPLHYVNVIASSNTEMVRAAGDFSIDPYNQLFAALAEARPDEQSIYQVVIAPLPQSLHTKFIEHAEGILQSQYLNDTTKDPLSDTLKKFEKKLPIWRAQIRLASTNPAAPHRLLKNFLMQYRTNQQQFTLSELEQADALPRDFTDYCFISTRELASLAHFPTKTVTCEVLETASMKSKLPPESYTKDGIQIGKSHARGQTVPVKLPHSTRDRHVYVVGKSGTGKSTLLYNCICQDLESGSGVAVIDPHGDLVEDVLKFIPESRIEDTIYFNAGDKEYPISLNILNAENEEEIGLLADDLLVTFKRISETWGERMDTILRYTFHTMLRVPDTTLLDLASLFQNPSYRERILGEIDIPLLLDFWQHQYTNYPKDAAQPVLNRLAKFALSPTLSGILGQSSSNLNFFDVIQNKKILLVNLSKGVIGEDSAQLLGSLLVSQLQLAIMRRASLPKESRDPYFLYVDEFQNFTTSAFEKILSEARKYKLCLTLAHQYISQLDERTKSAILANVGTIVMFQSYPQDAAVLRPELGQYEPVDVTNLNIDAHEALCKPATQSKDTFKFQTLAPLKPAQSFVREIIDHTRENYSEGPRQEPASPAALRPATPLPDQPRRPLRVPIRALPKTFESNQDKILYFVGQAEWLATAHLHALCYSHIEKDETRKSAASRDLSALVGNKRLKSTVFGSGKIYYTGRTCNPTNHNRAIRDLYTKIVASGYEVAEVNFFPDFKTLRPDLLVSFLAGDGSFIKSFWEYDAGTEDVADLVKKVERYKRYTPDDLITFVFNSEDRLRVVNRTIKEHCIRIAVLDQFKTLDDEAFRYASEEGDSLLSFFALD